MTPSGKVNRRALPAPDTRGSRLEDAFVPPRNTTEETLAEIWVRLLHVDRVGVFDNFFELGGHSLLAMQLLARVHVATRVAMPLLKFFEAPTVSAMSGFVEAVPTSVVPPAIPRVSRGRRLAASWGQEHLWHLNQGRPQPRLFNIAYAVRVAGALDLAILERTVAALVERHETLRTTFQHVDGRLIQNVAPRARVPIAVTDLRQRPASTREEDSRRLARVETRQLFDLRRGPLLRLSGWRLKDHEHLLLVSMHHIISDGWSVGVFIRELALLYNAYAAGHPSPLPALPIQYADFAHWQRQWARDASLRAHLAYWKRQLRGPWRAPALSADRPRRPGMLASARRLDIALPRGLSTALVTLSRREGHSLFMIATAAIKMLLYACTGEEDQRVATFLANRQRPEAEAMIGLVADMIVLRTDLRGNPTCREVLRRVREVSLEAYAHQEFPFEELARTLESERGVARAALSRVMIIWQGSLRLDPQVAALPVGFFELDQGWLLPETTVTTFDLVFALHETSLGLTGSCFYNQSLFDEGTVRSLLADWYEVLEITIAHPDQSLTAFRSFRGVGKS